MFYQFSIIIFISEFTNYFVRFNKNVWARESEENVAGVSGIQKERI